MSERWKVVIEGGRAFCGPELNSTLVDVTHMARRDYHLFQPLLYQFAMGSPSAGETASLLWNVLSRRTKLPFCWGDVVDIDPDSNLAFLANGTNVSYDSFGHNDWQEWAPGMKSVEEATAIPIERTSKLVAIIDDDETIQDSLRDLIKTAGHVARCFGSAEEFLESDLHTRAACLITDICMPRMSGLQLQGRLKEEKCDIPIIFITAHGDARMRIRAMREGAVEFLAKPLDHHLLLKRVRAALAM